MTSIDCNELDQIKLAFIWTPEEFKSAYKDHSVAGTRLMFRKIFWVLLVIASLLYVLLVSLQKGLSLESGVFGICLLLIGGVAILYSPWYQTRQFLRYRAALCGKTMQWEITPTELVNSLSDGTGGMTHWDSITSARKGTRGILLYITPVLFYWFPYHAFTSSEDIDQLEKLVAKNVTSYRKVESIMPRIVTGFLIAPLFAPLPTFFYNLIFMSTPAPTLIMDTAMTSLPIAYIVAVLLGVPLFLLLRKFSLFTLTSTLIGGVILGLLPILLLAPKAILRIAGEGHSFYLCALAVNGLISALAFWMIIGINNCRK